MANVLTNCVVSSQEINIFYEECLYLPISYLRGLFKLFFILFCFCWSPTGGYSLFLRMAPLTTLHCLIVNLSARVVKGLFIELIASVGHLHSFSHKQNLPEDKLYTWQQPWNLLYLCKSSSLESPLVADWRAHQFFQTFDARLFEVWQ